MSTPPTGAWRLARAEFTPSRPDRLPATPQLEPTTCTRGDCIRAAGHTGPCLPPLPTDEETTT